MTTALVEVPVAGSTRALPATRVARRPVGRRLLGALPPYLYLLPLFVGLAIWIYRPLVQTAVFSFDSWNLLPTSSPVFVGWKNYLHVLTLPQLGPALATTGLYLGGMIVAGVLLPVIVGTVVNSVGPRARLTYRALIFVPVLLAPVVVAAIFGFLLAPQDGLITQAVALFTTPPANWFTDPDAARWSIVMMSAWKVLGVSVLIVGAGIAGVDPVYHEAAQIDGASRGQAFRRLTLPLLSPTILFLAITAVLLSSQAIFPLINSTTLGGPAGASTDIYYLLYTYGFTSFDVGTASAAAVLFFLAFGVIAVVCIRLLDRWSFHDN
jgi:multiple sugar transport system permease protein